MSIIKANTIENLGGDESHDVATMGIESGINDNGSYVKFPDGTMICNKRVECPYPITLALGSSFTSSSLIYVGAYALPFVSTPVQQITSYNDGGSGSSVYSAVGPDLNSGGTFLLTRHTSSSNTDWYVLITAIGRWK